MTNQPTLSHPPARLTLKRPSGPRPLTNEEREAHRQGADRARAEASSSMRDMELRLEREARPRITEQAGKVGS